MCLVYLTLYYRNRDYFLRLWDYYFGNYDKNQAYYWY